MFVSPEIDDDVEIEIKADLRIDIYRASGAGGQHVNKTDSAVRITHLPTGIVVQCQNERSPAQEQGHGHEAAPGQALRAGDAEAQRAQQALEETKADIGWGSQIRSYVLDQSRSRTSHRRGVGNAQAVLDGDLDPFIEASLKSGL